jgi:hypothetical protein
MFRRWLLWVHGTVLTLVALGSAAATTIGRMIGIGPFGFMQQNPMVWVGLIQAHLLITIIAVLLILGAGSGEYQKVARRRRVGARSSFNGSLVVIGCIRLNGRVRNCLDTDYVSYRLSES